MRLVITPPCFPFGQLALEPVKVYQPGGATGERLFATVACAGVGQGKRLHDTRCSRSDSSLAGASGFGRHGGGLRQSHQPEDQGVKHSIGQKALDRQSQMRVTGSRIARSGPPRR